MFYITVSGIAMSRRQRIMSILFDEFYALPVDHPLENPLLRIISVLMRITDDEYDIMWSI